MATAFGKDAAISWNRSRRLLFARGSEEKNQRGSDCFPWSTNWETEHRRSL